MKQEKQQQIFTEEVDKKVQHMIEELDITTASAVGCLHVIIHEILRNSEEEEDHETETN